MLPVLPFVAGLATGIAAIQLWRSKKARTKFLAIKTSTINAVKKSVKDPDPAPTAAESAAVLETAVVAADDVPAKAPAPKRVTKKSATGEADSADANRGNA